jgi:hypothetical protein
MTKSLAELDLINSLGPKKSPRLRDHILATNKVLALALGFESKFL